MAHSGHTHRLGDGAGPTPRRRQARGDRTRSALVDAAFACFGDRGVDPVSVDEITSSANVAKGTFYVHFQHKTDVLLERAAQLVDDVDPHPATGNLRRDLDALAADLAAALSELPRGVTGRMVREIVGNPEDWMRILGPRPALRAMIRPSLDAAAAAGQLRRDLSTRRQAQFLTILWLDTVIGWAEHPEDRDLDAELGKATALFCDGARP